MPPAILTVSSAIEAHLNGSMFDSGLAAEEAVIGSPPTSNRVGWPSWKGASVRSGNAPTASEAYAFKMDSIETISGIYEIFPDPRKTEQKATRDPWIPRLHLHETTLETVGLLLEKHTQIGINSRYFEHLVADRAFSTV